MNDSPPSIGTRPYADRSVVRFEALEYGRSVKGLPLEYYPPASGTADILLFAGIHGTEPESCILLSRALRSLQELPDRCAVILNANPDGLLHGTRGNANSVDLNRNFPASNWSAESVTDWWIRDCENTLVELSTGSKPASEPETVALLSLLEKLQPELVITLHGPLGCIDDPANTELGRWISGRTGLKHVQDIGYPTPGSFGSWALERDLDVITYELPLENWWNMQEVHLPVLQKLLYFGMQTAEEGTG